jgi:hypothetical protein
VGGRKVMLTLWGSSCVWGGGVDGGGSSLSWLSPSWSEQSEGVGASADDAAEVGADEAFDPGIDAVEPDAELAAAVPSRQSRTRVCVLKDPA